MPEGIKANYYALRVKFLREVKLELSYAILALGLFVSLFAILHFVLRDAVPQALVDILDAIGSWVVWFVLVGPLLVIIGGWYFIDIVRKKREFDTLLDVPSKARFVRNQTRLEELSWYLPSEYHRKLVDRKRHWKIKE